MTTTKFDGLTVKEIKVLYPDGKYTSKMLRADVIKAAQASEKEVKKTESRSGNTEPGYKKARG